MLKIFVLLYFLIDFFILSSLKYSFLKVYSLYVIVLGIKLSLTKQQIILQQQQYSLKCKICLKPKPPRFYHCRHCNKCIYLLDHHCHWLQNCIGHYNAKTYVLFLLNLVGKSVLSTLFIFIDGSTIQITFIVIPSLFCVYEGIRLIKAFHLNLIQNQTLIQSYKRVKGKKQNYWAMVKMYFGKQKFMWLVPWGVGKGNYLQQVDGKGEQLQYADQYIYGKDQQQQYIKNS